MYLIQGGTNGSGGFETRLSEPLHSAAFPGYRFPITRLIYFDHLKSFLSDPNK